MTKFAIAFAAAGMLLALPTFSAPASADPNASANMKMAQVDVRIGTPGPRRVYREVRRDRCSTTVVIRNGRRTVIKKCR